MSPARDRCKVKSHIPFRITLKMLSLFAFSSLALFLSDYLPSAGAEDLVSVQNEGKRVFRHETFGNEGFVDGCGPAAAWDDERANDAA